MKKALLIMAITVAFAACGGNNTDADNTSSGSANMGDPSKVHPEAETIPDSLRLVNDSTIVHDSTGNQGTVGNQNASQNK